MINEWHVLTGGHCCYNRDTATWASNMWVTPGQTDVFDIEHPLWVDRPFGSARATLLTTWGYNTASEAEKYEYDYCLVQLDREIGLRSGTLTPIAFPILDGETLFLKGFPGADFDTRLMYEGSVVFDQDESEDYLGTLGYSTNEVVMTFDALACGGDSGSGLVNSGNSIDGVTAFVVRGPEYCPDADPDCCSCNVGYKKLTSTSLANLNAAMASAESSPGSPTARPSIIELARDDVNLGGNPLKSISDTMVGVPFSTLFHIWNAGTADSGDVTIEYYFSDVYLDPSLASPLWVFLESELHGSISANTFSVISTTVASPPAGNWHIYARHFSTTPPQYLQEWSHVTIYLGQITVSTASDTCTVHDSCGDCTNTVSCGWCDNYICVDGTSSGPSSGSCGSWEWLPGDCPSDPCTGYVSCDTCISDSNCGWCETTDSCRAGTISGPSDPIPACSNWDFVLGSCPDPCNTFDACGLCTSQPNCGWCESTILGACRTGSAGGPPGYSCADWDWLTAECPVDPCSVLAGCDTCLADPDCGWCETRWELALGAYCLSI